MAQALGADRKLKLTLILAADGFRKQKLFNEVFQGRILCDRVNLLSMCWGEHASQ
jgi:hypothetical protein